MIFKVKFNEAKTSFSVDFGIVNVISNDHEEHYQGPYSVKPKFTQQIMTTKNKIMDNDFTVQPIGVCKTTNTSGGLTAYIGA